MRNMKNVSEVTAAINEIINGRLGDGWSMEVWYDSADNKVWVNYHYGNEWSVYHQDSITEISAGDLYYYLAHFFYEKTNVTDDIVARVLNNILDLEKYRNRDEIDDIIACHK